MYLAGCSTLMMYMPAPNDIADMSMQPDFKAVIMTIIAMMTSR